jgi:protein-S-isoprenylcysteine O-methyltransferase Ste14
MFDDAMVRFAASGTLIGLYGVADYLAARREPDLGWPRIKVKGWVKATIFTSILAYYALIGPWGGSLAGGAGNLAGIGLAVTAMVLRYLLRRRTGRIRHPAIAARMLFYLALPLAVGVPWGWLALTLPACLVSAWCAVREDRLLATQVGRPYLRLMARSDRWIPGVW